jgi:predicted RNA-binding protein
MMHLEIIRHDGPARLGILHFEGQKIPTPSLLWSPAGGPLPPGYLEITPLEYSSGHGIINYGTIYSEGRLDEFGILPNSPSGYDVPENMAIEAVAKTVESSKVKPEFGAVVEGGKYVHLRKECAVALWTRPLLKIANADRLVKNHRKLVEVITAIREAVSPNTAIYLSDVPPHLLPILVYMGVDLFDLKFAILGAHEGRYLTMSGIRNRDKLSEYPCSCSVCASSKPGELDFKQLLSHNVNITTASIREVRESMRVGGLRNLVEERAAGDLNTMGALRILDIENQEFLEKYTQTSPFFTSYKLKVNRGL